MSDANTIHLAGEYRKLQSLELASGQTPKPGMLLIITSAGELTVHATQGGYAERLIALEDALQGKTKADAYVAETLCDCAIEIPGSESQVLLSTSSSAVVIGDHLCSQGDGKFEKIDTGDIPLCIATEALDLTVSGAVDTLCSVRWL